MRPAPLRGLYEDRLWGYVRRGELRLQRCRACGRFMYPPAPVCAGCWGADLDWTPVGGVGGVLSWTRFHRTYFPELPAPYVVAAVELDEGPIVVADTLPADWAPRIGQRVRLVFDGARDGVEPPLFHWADAGLPAGSTDPGRRGQGRSRHGPLEPPAAGESRGAS